MEKGLKSSHLLVKEMNKKKERISKSKATSSAAASMKFCVCAPPTHPDSFKCRLHRATTSAHPRTGKYFCYICRKKGYDKKHSIFRVLTKRVFCSSYQFHHQRQRRFAYVHPPPTLAHSSVAFTEPPLHLTQEPVNTSATKKWFVTKKGSIFRVLTNHVFSFPSFFAVSSSAHHINGVKGTKNLNPLKLVTSSQSGRVRNSSKGNVHGKPKLSRFGRAALAHAAAAATSSVQIQPISAAFGQMSLS